MPPDAPPARLQTELATYEAHKPELLALGEGKYVLIQGTTIHGVWGTYEDALTVGYQTFGVNTPFLVKQISGIEQVQFFTRDVNACPS